MFFAASSEIHCPIQNKLNLTLRYHEFLPKSFPLKSALPNDPAEVTMSRLLPMDVKRADNPGDGPTLAAIPNPRRSRVGCLGPNTEGVPNINSFRPEPASHGSPRPRPAANDAPLASLGLPLHSWWPFEDDVEDITPMPLKNDELVAAAPIWAAFCSNAVADIAGCGAGAYCLRSWPAGLKIDELWLIARPRDIGSVDEGGAISRVCSGAMARNISEKTGAWDGRLPEAVDEANKLPKTLLLLLPLLQELLQFPVKLATTAASSTTCFVAAPAEFVTGFSRNSAQIVAVILKRWKEAYFFKETEKVKTFHRKRTLSIAKGDPNIVSFLYNLYLI